MTKHKVNLNPCAVSIFKGEAFEATSAALYYQLNSIFA